MSFSCPDCGKKFELHQARCPSCNCILSPRFVGITGAFGSGCTESAKYLENQHDFKHISISQIIRDIKKHEITGNLPDRRMMQDFGNQIREDKGDHHLMDLAIRQVLGNTPDDGTPPFVAIETIRNPAEAEWLLTVPNAYLLAIYASQKERMRRNNCSTDVAKAEFIKADLRDSGETEPQHGQQVTNCVNMADYFIENDTQDHSDLWQKIDIFVRKIHGLVHHTPSTEEVMMSHAFMQRLFSKCKGRQVGAVLALGKHIISTGWNGVPTGTNDCVECNRKLLRSCVKCGENLLANLGPCPHCEEQNEDKKNILEKHLDLCYAVHAEERAILNAKREIPIEAVLYCTTFPCLLCAKLIVETGIKTLYYVEPYPYNMSEKILENGGVKVKRFIGFTARHLYRLHARRN